MAFLRRNKTRIIGGAGGGSQTAQAPQPSYAPRAADLTVGDYANGMPNIRLGEMLKSFGRQLTWVVPLFLVGSLLAWHLTKDLKRTYTGDARILVQIGDEYVYQPITGQPGQAGLTLTADTIALNEVGIIKNDEIIEQVFGEMTSPTNPFAKKFDPNGMKKLRQAGNNIKLQREAKSEMYNTMDRAFMVSPRPKSSIIDLSYKHEDGEVAVATLHALILAYQSYRRQIFVEGTADIIAERRKETERQLGQNDRAIARLLKKNNISDFESEQGGVRKRTEELRASLNMLRAEMSETETALATVEGQLRQTPQEINLYVDDRASARISQAELELKQLLAKYLPTSDPVRQKRTELAELKSLQTSNGGKASGGRRVGPNSVFQELLTRRNILQATADSYREKEFTLQRQLDSADAKVRRLTALSPDYASLLRERDTLDERLKNYNAKEQEALVNQQQAEATNENVKVISWPKFPNKGSNTRLLAAAGAIFAWGLTLFMLALLRVFLDPRLYAAPSVNREGLGGAGTGADYIPEPVAPQVPTQTPMPAVAEPASALASHYPQAYGATAYDNSAYAGQAQTYYTSDEGAYNAQAYTDDATAQYSQNPVMQGQYDPNAYSQPSNNPVYQMEDTTAIDSNPYLGGQTAGPIPYDPNAPYG